MPHAHSVGTVHRREPLRRRVAIVFVMVGVSLVAGVCARGSEPGETALSFEHLVGDRLTPSQIVWQPSGAAVSYLWDAGDGTALWTMDAVTGVATEVMRPGGPGDGPADFGIDHYSWFPDSTTLLVEHEGDLFQRSADGGITRLTETESSEDDATLSPDGSKIAYTRDGDLYVFDLSRETPQSQVRGERALTEDGDGETIFNGTTDWVYWEEIWGRDSTGFWWSPDGSKIAYYRFEDHPVGQYPLVDDSSVYPTVRLQRYPKAGTTNPKVRLGVFDLASGKTTWLTTERTAEDGEVEETYLARLHWTPNGETVAVERLNRDQNRLDLLSCDPVDGACKAVVMDEAETWVNLGNDTTFLNDGRFVWASERDGWRHLYLYAANGRLERRLTSGAWDVTSIAHVDPDGPWIVFSRFGQGPLGAAERHVSAVSLTDPAAPMRDLTSGSGWHSAIVSPTARHWIHGWNDAATPETLSLRPAFGSSSDQPIARLPSVPPPYDVETLPRWQLLSIEAGNSAGESAGAKLPAQLLLPNDFDPERKYPVIMYHYGGPASQVVSDRWGTRGRSLWHKMMVERGYVVLKVDNVASAFYGKHGADRSHRRFGARNLEAQLAAVDWLKRQGWADLERIGLWGWSGGGSNTLYALLNAPGVWAAGMSGAPVTDWLLYDTIWTERYLDHPEDNPDGYRDSSAVTYAEQLSDPLLIVHGTGDDNVHPQNTMVLVERWIEAGIPFEQAIYPGQKHGFRGAASKHFFQRMTEFFDQHLMGGEED